MFFLNISILFKNQLFGNPRPKDYLFIFYFILSFQNKLRVELGKTFESALAKKDEQIAELKAQNEQVL